MKRSKIRTVKLSGTPYDMGYSHGQAYRDDIIRYAKERVSIVCEGTWSGGTMARADVLALAESCMPAHRAYAPDLVAEMDGMAAATGLTMGELVIVSGFTDFVDTVYAATHPDKVAAREPAGISRLPVDDCTAFIVPDGVAENSAGFFGQTWDMHDTATEFVILLELEPDEGPNGLVFTTTGCLGQIGMNEAGIAVGINNLMGADGQVGVTWPFVVRKVLQQDNLEDALNCITEANLSGAHNYLLFDSTGQGYNIEAMSTAHHITPLHAAPIVHTNHCLAENTLAVAQPRPPSLQKSTEARLVRGQSLLSQQPVTVDSLMALTRDPEAICVRAKPPFHVESCGAAIMRPKTGDMWAVWGLPDENEYEHFKV